jgi:hypothetical protein
MYIATKIKLQTQAKIIYILYKQIFYSDQTILFAQAKMSFIN